MRLLMICNNIYFKNLKKNEVHFFNSLNQFPYFLHQSAENTEGNVDESVKKAKKEDKVATISKNVMSFYL